MSVEFGELVVATGVAAGGGGGVGFLLKLLVDRFVGKADRETDKREAARDAKLEQVLTAVTQVQRDIATAAVTAQAQAAVVAEVKERIDGVSSNHGARLAALEHTTTQHGERLDMVALLDDRLERFAERIAPRKKGR